MEFLTPEEAAAKLKVTRRTVYKWLTSGRIKGVKLGDSSLWRIPESEMLRLLGESQGQK
ncbi:MAG: helix-turn-helix domain-containing protein [Patescibacteria group bacterium]